MYSVHDYGAMIADRVRMDAYAEALRQAVQATLLGDAVSPQMMMRRAIQHDQRSPKTGRSNRP